MVGGIAGGGLGSRFLVEFLSFVMRLSYRVSDLVMGGCNLVWVSGDVGVVIGQIACARRWNLSMVSITICAALLIWSVVTCADSTRWWMVSRAFGSEETCVFVSVLV